MKNGNEMPASILANVEVFDYLKDKDGSLRGPSGQIAGRFRITFFKKAGL